MVEEDVVLDIYDEALTEGVFVVLDDVVLMDLVLLALVDKADDEVVVEWTSLRIGSACGSRAGGGDGSSSATAECNVVLELVEEALVAVELLELEVLVELLVVPDVVDIDEVGEDVV